MRSATDRCHSTTTTSSDEMCEEEGEEEDEETVEDQETVYVIDSATMRDEKRFYDEDSDIDICLRRLHESFTNRCTIAWWYKNQVELKRCGTHRLNTPAYLAKLHTLLWKAVDYLNLFRFVGFFCVRDMHRWFREHCTDEDDTELPFGLIELGLCQEEQYGTFIQRRRAYTLNRELLFRCKESWVSKHYDVYIHDAGAIFKPLANKHDDCDLDANVVPCSPFFPLYFDKKRIIEAKLFEGDANNFATHPEPFLQSKLLAEADLEEVPERMRYTSDNLADLLHSETTHRVNVAARNTDHYISTSLNRKSRRAQHVEDEARTAYEEFMDEEEAPDTAYARRLEAFDRPSLKSMLRPLPANTSLVRGPPPHVLLKPQELQREYEDRVCNLLGVPHLYYNPYTHTTGNGAIKSGLTPSHLKFSHERMAETIARIERQFEELFYELYRRTFGLLDYEMFCSQDAQGVVLSRDIAARMKFFPPEKPRKKRGEKNEEEDGEKKKDSEEDEEKKGAEEETEETKKKDAEAAEEVEEEKDSSEMPK